MTVVTISPPSAVAMAALLLGVASAGAATPAGPDAVGSGYEYYRIGDVNAPTPGKTGPLLGLFGGGDWPIDAFRIFVKQSGGGHIVVLRARGGRELQDEIYNDVGGVVSVETLVIHNEDAGEDPKLLEIIARAFSSDEKKEPSRKTSRFSPFCAIFARVARC